MKASKKFIKKLKEDMQEFFDQLDPAEQAEFKEYQKDKNPERIRWDLFWHLRAVGKNYDKYLKELKDQHIDTALKRAFNKVNTYS